MGSTFTYWILSGFRLVNLWCLWRSLSWELTGFAKDSIFLFCVGLFLFLFCLVEFGISAFLVWRLCWLRYFTFINQDRTWEWFFYFWLKSYEGCELERIGFFVYNKLSVIYMLPCNVLCVLKQGKRCLCILCWKFHSISAFTLLQGEVKKLKMRKPWSLCVFEFNTELGFAFS